MSRVDWYERQRITLGLIRTRPERAGIIDEFGTSKKEFGPERRDNREGWTPRECESIWPHGFDAFVFGMLGVVVDSWGRLAGIAVLIDAASGAGRGSDAREICEPWRYPHEAAS